jgi:hypothetical protein
MGRKALRYEKTEKKLTKGRKEGRIVLRSETSTGTAELSPALSAFISRGQHVQEVCQSLSFTRRALRRSFETSVTTTSETHGHIPGDLNPHEFSTGIKILLIPLPVFYHKAAVKIVNDASLPLRL